MRDARNRHNMSGFDLAVASGVGIDTIRSIESGRVASPGILVIARLARALNEPLEQITARALAISEEREKE